MLRNFTFNKDTIKKRTSIGRSCFSRPKNKHKRRSWKSIEDRGNDAESGAKYFVHEYSPVALYLDDCFLMKKKSKKKGKIPMSLYIGIIIGSFIVGYML